MTGPHHERLERGGGGGHHERGHTSYHHPTPTHRLSLKDFGPPMMLVTGATGGGDSIGGRATPGRQGSPRERESVSSLGGPNSRGISVQNSTRSSLARINSTLGFTSQQPFTRRRSSFTRFKEDMQAQIRKLDQQEEDMSFKNDMRTWLNSPVTWAIVAGGVVLEVVLFFVLKYNTRGDTRVYRIGSNWGQSERVAQAFIAGLFMVELGLRLSASGLSYFSSWLNVMDSYAIVTSFSLILLTPAAGFVSLGRTAGVVAAFMGHYWVGREGGTTSMRGSFGGGGGEGNGAGSGGENAINGEGGGGGEYEAAPAVQLYKYVARTVSPVCNVFSQQEKAELRRLLHMLAHNQIYVHLGLQRGNEAYWKEYGSQPQTRRYSVNEMVANASRVPPSAEVHAQMLAASLDAKSNNASTTMSDGGHSSVRKSVLGRLRSSVSSARGGGGGGGGGGGEGESKDDAVQGGGGGRGSAAVAEAAAASVAAAAAYSAVSQDPSGHGNGSSVGSSSPLDLSEELNGGHDGLLEQLLSVDDWDFNAFELDEVSLGHPLVSVCNYLFDSQKYNFFHHFNLSKRHFTEAMIQIERGYGSGDEQGCFNVYHNRRHAADVTQGVHFFMHRCNLGASLTDIERISLLLAAIVHDFKHPGRSNAFLIKTRDELALIYNDVSVLENYHLAEAFRVLRNDRCNFFRDVEAETVKNIRDTMIPLVLATDLKLHFDLLGEFNAHLADIQVTDFGEENKTRTYMSAMKMCIKSADIGHPTRTRALHLKWTKAVVEEFFLQGDEEQRMGLELSPLCDRNTTGIADSQQGFINFLVKPLFKGWVAFLDTPEAAVCMENLEDNEAMWVEKGLAGSDTLAALEEEEEEEKRVRAKYREEQQRSDLTSTFESSLTAEEAASLSTKEGRSSSAGGGSGGGSGLESGSTAATSTIVLSNGSGSLGRQGSGQDWEEKQEERASTRAYTIDVLDVGGSSVGATELEEGVRGLEATGGDSRTEKEDKEEPKVAVEDEEEGRARVTQKGSESLLSIAP